LSSPASVSVAAPLAIEALERLLRTDGAALRASLPTGFAADAETYVRLLLAANRRVNLTRVVEPDAVARLHLLDALAALPLLDEREPHSVVDLGSGGGVPGMVLALARPSIRWLLVDSVARKTAALESFVDTLALPNVAVLAARAEALGRDPAHRERYDLVTARACAALAVVVEYALPLLKPGGTLLAWKGALDEQDPEIVAGRAAVEALGGGSLRLVDPGMAALDGHRFVVVEKGGPTPGRFPRRPGVPVRRPLA
jgi:16S rRNA (guanine527-N7)-methyltransferase